MTAAHFAGVDLGAESGRVMIGTLSDGRLELREAHRFPNRPCLKDGTLYWDVQALFTEIKTGIGKASWAVGGSLAGVGVDTWGVDFGLLDSRGELLGNPVHYRDARTNGILEKAFKIIPRHEIYGRTGIQFLQFNSLFQLLAMKLADPAELDAACDFLMMPDLFNFWLTGRRSREFTNATTTQAYDPLRGDWAWDLIDALDLPRRIFGPVTPPGVRLGEIGVPGVCESALPGVPVYLPATHDTGSAVAAVPASGENWAYISCGTWALVGVETDRPVISDDALRHNFTNEGGVFGTTRLLSNVMGLWLLQRCKAAWEAQGNNLDYDRIVNLAAASSPFAGWLDVDDPLFFNPEDMPAAILEFGRQTGQELPASMGAIARIVMESLALKYRLKLREAAGLSGRTIDVIHIVGGGSRNTLLCQMTADACNARVVAGPTEATAMGNILMQAAGAGLLGSLTEIRAMVRMSSSLKIYEPSPSPKWDEMVSRLSACLMSRS